MDSMILTKTGFGYAETDIIFQEQDRISYCYALKMITVVIETFARG